MKKLVFLIAFYLPFSALSQNKRIGVVYYWSGHQSSYSSFYHLPYGVFSSDDSATLKKKLFHNKKQKNEITSEWFFYNVGIRLDNNIYSKQYFLRTEINYSRYSKNFKGTTQYVPYYLQDISGTQFLNSLEFANTFCRTIQINNRISFNFGLGFSFWTSFNGKSIDQIFYPYPVNSSNANNDYFYIYKYYPQSYFINTHLILEARYKATEKLNFIFSIYNGYNYYWANGYDISITEIFKYEPNNGYVRTGGGWSHNQIKEKGISPDILKPALSIMWQLN
ncbi:MAG: hypothetical protein HYY40_08955 [Bacteroidetes bacterium]|nr:hypothetical protein [Bacteroidota bacterium]